MKLVFFDIECACVHKTYAKICAFGYVVCDEKFNILQKEDILINPNGRFELTSKNGEKGIVLPYDYNDFKRYPIFKSVYCRIRNILEDKDSYILGHAVSNDVKFLNCETRRYKLPPLNFSFLDSQLIFMTHNKDFSHQIGLEQIAKILGVEFTPHRAVDDAYATMKITEALCKANGCTFPELIKKLNLVAGRTERGRVTLPQSIGIKHFYAEKREEKAQISQRRIEFFNYLSRKRISKAGGVLKGKAIAFSREIENETELSISLVDKIYAAGGEYVSKIHKCNLYVCNPDDSTARTLSAAERAVPIMDLQSFEELLND